jgi:hypothetical protein
MAQLPGFPQGSSNKVLKIQFMGSPARSHWEAVKRVFKYLKGSRQLRSTYGKTKNGLTVYTDGDWGSHRSWLRVLHRANEPSKPTEVNQNIKYYKEEDNSSIVGRHD